MVLLILQNTAPRRKPRHHKTAAWYNAPVISWHSLRMPAVTWWIPVDKNHVRQPITGKPPKSRLGDALLGCHRNLHLDEVVPFAGLNFAWFRRIWWAETQQGNSPRVRLSDDGVIHIWVVVARFNPSGAWKHSTVGAVGLVNGTLYTAVICLLEAGRWAVLMLVFLRSKSRSCNVTSTHRAWWLIEI